MTHYPSTNYRPTMKKLATYTLAAMLTAVLATACGTTRQTACKEKFAIDNVAGFPSQDPGYALGVSACYAGHTGNYIIIAGGCNFPVPGQKRYYDGIYAARTNADSLAWQLVGRLPEAVAYGATVESGDSLIFIGGNNSQGSMRLVTSVHLDTTRMQATLNAMPPLPVTVDNLGAALCGAKVVAVGGNQDGKPSAKVWTMQLGGNTGWTALPSVPGSPRVQPTVAGCGSNVYVWGGFYQNGDNSAVNTDGHCLDTATGQWHALPAPTAPDGETLTLSGATATVTGGTAGTYPTIICAGGVNKDIFLDAISGRYRLVDKAKYLEQPIPWYRFNGTLLQFDTHTGQWTDTNITDSRLARAGALLVHTDQHLYYIGGELKPALRTPQTLTISARPGTGGKRLK